MQYRYAKFIATRYLQYAGERNVMQRSRRANNVRIFFCNNEMVYWTNGGCRELFLGWASCAEKIGYINLSKTLRAQVELGYGCASTGIDDQYLCEELADVSAKTEWVEVMDFFINEVSKTGAIAKSLDVKWDQELIQSWLLKLKIMRDTLKLQLHTA